VRNFDAEGIHILTSKENETDKYRVELQYTNILREALFIQDAYMRKSNH